MNAIVEPENPSATNWRDVRRATAIDHPAFSRMRALCVEHELPHRHGADIDFHDRRQLQREVPLRPFAWLLYRDGSFVAWEQLLLASMVEVFSDDVYQSKLYLWDGRHLLLATYDDAREALQAWNAQHSAVQWRREHLGEVP